MFYILNRTVLKPMAKWHKTKKTIDKMKQSRYKTRFIVCIEYRESTEQQSREQKLWAKRLDVEHPEHELNYKWNAAHPIYTNLKRISNGKFTI